MRRLLLLAVVAVAMLGPLEAEASAGTVAGTVTPVGWASEVEVCVVGTSICSVPNAGGTYQLVGVDGQVKVQFVPSYRSGLVTQYYNHKRSASEATILLVPTQGGVTGIDADLLEGGVIEGTVTAALGGAALAEVEVCATAVEAPNLRSCVETDATGGYELHSLPTARYTVAFFGSGKSAAYGRASFGEPPTQISISEGQKRTGVDAALGKGAELTGLVTDAATGGPLFGIDVCAFAAAGSTAQRCTFTDGAGRYDFQGLTEGIYQVGFSLEGPEIGGLVSAGGADGFESQFWDGVATRAQATSIALFGGGIAAGIDAALGAPSPPPSVLPPPIAAAPLVAAPAPITVPPPKKTGCRKPLRKKKVRGKVRCVKVVKRTHHRHHHRKRVCPSSSSGSCPRR
jgi:hypothetical protein